MPTIQILAKSKAISGLFLGVNQIGNELLKRINKRAPGNVMAVKKSIFFLAKRCVADL